MTFVKNCEGLSGLGVLGLSGLDLFKTTVDAQYVEISVLLFPLCLAALGYMLAKMVLSL